MEHNITLFEACEILSRSKKSVSRYIRRGLLHPIEVKSKQGTLEYRFNKEDLEKFKMKVGQDKTGRDETRQEPPAKIIPAPPIETEETRPPQTTQDKTGQDIVPVLLEQIKVKDEQIKTMSGQISEMIERDREKNVLMRGLQDKLLGGPKE